MTALAPRRLALRGELAHRARRLGIDTGQEPVVYLRCDSSIVRSEALAREARVALVTCNTIPHPSNRIDVLDAVRTAVERRIPLQPVPGPRGRVRRLQQQADAAARRAGGRHRP